MDDYLISQFIDDELVLDEKIQFVNKVHQCNLFTEETLAYLEQEKMLHSELEPWKPSPVHFDADAFSWKTVLNSWWQPLAGFATAMVLAIFIFSGFGGRFQQDIVDTGSMSTAEEAVHYRFVLYQEAAKVEIVGSFTNWQKVPLVPTGAGAYWEITLPVARGEHKYSFVVDGKELLPDPTVAAREPDDFGTMNSIINVEA